MNQDHPHRMTRDRFLTPEEGERLRAVREAVEREKPEIVARLKNQLAGPGSFADLDELRTLVRSLRAGREAAGLSREQLADRAQLDAALVADLEEQRDINPPLSVLSRYAAALGQRLHMGLVLAERQDHAPA